MMEELRSLEDLLDLQLVDSEIDRLLERRSSLPEREQYREAHRKTEELEAERRTLSDSITESSRALDKASGELEILEEKAVVEERRLYAGGLGARETLNLREEVDMIRRQIGTREGEVLELMEQRDQEDTQAAELDRAIAEAKAVEAKLEGRITDQWRVIDAEIAAKEARKADIVPLIPPELIEMYEELRPIKEGVAVGRLAEGICGGCHLRLTPAEQLEAKKSHPPRCIHCRRILVPQ